jgi:TfoX/Sxy family transcriptional regulator of competence genes
MAYDESLAARIEEILVDRSDVIQKKMFGGLAFMVRQHMCVGVMDDMIMARVGPQHYAECLQQDYAKEMTFTGKPLKGMVYVEPKGISCDTQLRSWIRQCLNFVDSLPDKKPKHAKGSA